MLKWMKYNCLEETLSSIKYVYKQFILHTNSFEQYGHMDKHYT